MYCGVITLGKEIIIDMSLTLYTSPGCHLCEQAEEILDYVGVAFTAVDISTDVDLVRQYGVRIPVLQRSDRQSSVGPLTPST